MTAYTVYLGLNDRDSKKQEISTEDALLAVRDYLLANFGFGTVSLATGYYTHNDGKKVAENTIRIELSGDGIREKIVKMKEHFEIYFNQESVFVTASAVEVL